MYENKAMCNKHISEYNARKLPLSQLDITIRKVPILFKQLLHYASKQFIHFLSIVLKIILMYVSDSVHSIVHNEFLIKRVKLMLLVII